MSALSPSLRRARELTRLGLRLTGLPSGFSLHTSGRELLMEAHVTKEIRGRTRPSRQRRCFVLFSDLLLYAEVSKSKSYEGAPLLKYKGSIAREQLKVSVDGTCAPNELILTNTKENKVYCVGFVSHEERELWIRLMLQRSKAGAKRCKRSQSVISGPSREGDMKRSLVLNRGADPPPFEPISRTAAVLLAERLLRRVMAVYRRYYCLVRSTSIHQLSAVATDADFAAFAEETQKLQAVNLACFQSDADKVCFFTNVHNCLVLHSAALSHSLLRSDSSSSQLPVFLQWQASASYSIGGHVFSILLLENFVLHRRHRVADYVKGTLLPTLPNAEEYDWPKSTRDEPDPRQQAQVADVEALVAFVLFKATASSPHVEVLRLDSLETQLKRLAEHYLSSHVRMFLEHECGKLSIHLPASMRIIRENFITMNDFGLLMWIAQYLPTEMATSLQRLCACVAADQLELVLTYEDYDATLTYPVAPSVYQATQRCLLLAHGGVVQHFAFAAPGESRILHVQEKLTESRWTFSVPAQLLGLLFEVRSQATDVPEAKHRDLSAHVDSLAELMLLCKGGAHTYHNLSFRPSRCKEDAALSCLPLNLHLQRLTAVETAGDQSVDATALDAAESDSFYTITVGAFAAHSMGFKNGGLLQLQETIHELDLLLYDLEAGQSTNVAPTLRKLGVSHETLSDLESDVDLSSAVKTQLRMLQFSFNMRLDLCLPQAVAVLVTSLAAMLRDHSRVTERLALWADLGFLLHFESLLSTRGMEVGMLADHAVAVEYLKNFHIRFAPASAQEELDAAERATEMSGDFCVAEDPHVVGVKIVQLPPQRRQKGVRGSESRRQAPHSPVRPGSPGPLGEAPKPPKSASDRGRGVSRGKGVGIPRSQQLLMAGRGTASRSAALVMENAPERMLSSSLPSMKSTPSLLMHAKKQGLKGSRIGSPSIGRRTDSTKRAVPGQQLRREGSKGFIDGDSSGEAAQFAIVFTVTSTLMDLLPATLCCGQYMGVVPVLFTQGINEQQTMANRSHATDLRVQTHINKSSLETLTAYFIRYTAGGYGGDARAELEAEFANVNQAVRAEGNFTKNVRILHETADFTRKLGAGRVTSCKSAKDRTSMAVTWEQARQLGRDFDLSERLISEITREMRICGVRRENAFKNIGQRLFAFNAIQRKLLPKEYRNPQCTGGAAQA